ncbi:hypothetical protein NGA_0603000 [Nannochloropsis gaditana CCMP526]|uniref:uncharacterized protein n=1 Tax=Nannochloropsis gaditana (strain CCMP526) TaxID=1093141 RepID=UPI00029F564D|nr:hypothetical protein NGA_0603000 [Nannochloropsis gaditana CCMP526]EKU20603.1 hypothetical protein NGA_0603000 [Nannochloropsis gaditana CCMP526]|eukprot:XP_005855762.1 hypothetical protein NGA_0603000 [Nannochloropsis gaditana CCMP526]
MSKIRFQVVYASGQDPEHPAEELNVHSPATEGWQSPRFCDYPQELGLFLLDTPCHLSRVQILSHQSKIATKVELFVGDGGNYAEAAFARLGYLSLNSNQRSNFRARELKSVFVSCSGRFLKLVIHRCHVNKFNLFNQVGFVAINLLGEGGPDPSPEPFLPPHHAGGADEEGVHDLAYELSPFDPDTTRRLRALLAAKEGAVRAENYDEAKRLKAAEAALREGGQRISALEEEKRQAVREEEYDRAKALKEEIEGVRAEVEGRIGPLPSMSITRL